MQHLPPEPWRWDAVDMARAIRLKAISAREATESVLARCAAVNPALNAVVQVLDAEARAAADAADAALARGEAIGPLHGVPVSTKINVDQTGCATSNGCVGLRDLVAAEDSAVVGNLRHAGAILFGRTNTPALSMRWFTENELHGRTLNPWHAGHTPGGSSGGAASAVAAGIGPIAHGNDLGGSVRYPAYACGVAGIRPSFGRIPAYNPTMTGERPISAQLMSTQGPLARSVRDLRLALSVMAEGDIRDPWWMPAPLDGPPPPRPIRVALCVDPAGTGVHPAVAEAVRRAGRILAAAGYAVEEASPPDFPGTAADWEALSRTEGRIHLRDAFMKVADGGARETFDAMMARAPQLDLTAWTAVAARRTTRQRQWAQFLKTHTILLLPVSSEPPFPQGLDVAGQQAFDSVFRAQLPMLAAPLLGLPGVSVPTGLAEGLPMGVQLMAARWREDLILDAAEVIEAACPMPTPIDPRG
ncbi:amidase family protein [Roseomonas sp. JC162]|uniref:Amidase family protein n=1 Tax=Neoroseomonas marina TaxID=1232220 RepID=A0A848E968_9PROT|nr:amidase family protein [Neoroseomonas marina]NMJ40117.1 amidase family protein [Neoroseomonas marina]